MNVVPSRRSTKFENNNNNNTTNTTDSENKNTNDNNYNNNSSNSYNLNHFMASDTLSFTVASSSSSPRFSGSAVVPSDSEKGMYLL